MTDNPADAASDGKPGLFGRVRAGLAKTRGKLSEGLQDVFLGAKSLDDALLEELEALLLSADVGVRATGEILAALTANLGRKEIDSPDAVRSALKRELAAMLEPVQVPLEADNANEPFVVMMVGVNGAGKTTTAGKLAQLLVKEGKSVMLAAGDTYRAAATEQLKEWGDKCNVPVVAQYAGADSASVCFDALASARAKNVDVLIADTAGRLQNKQNLMDELAKVARVLAKQMPDAPHEVLLVLDAGTGQNAISQAQEFMKAVNVSGVALTKLDGSAKGGVIFAVARQLRIPIRFIGVGEGAEDLRPFDAGEFVDALLE